MAFPPGRPRPRYLHKWIMASLRKKISVKYGFPLLVLLYLIITLWSYSTVTELHQSDTSVHYHHFHHQHEGGSRNTRRHHDDEHHHQRGQRHQQDNNDILARRREGERLRHHHTDNRYNNDPTLTEKNESLLEMLPRVENATNISVLILISSVVRKKETVCTTIKGVINNYLRNEEDTDGRSSPLLTVSNPHILLHRYGSSPACNVSSTSSLTLEEYPIHQHASNQQQMIDYLHLIDHAIEFTLSRWNNSSKLFTHVMFLDDDVELCAGFSKIIATALQSFPSRHIVGHFGRGGSGLFLPAHELPKLRQKIKMDYSQLKTTPKNVDTSIMEYGLQNLETCVLRPTAIHMRHIGFESSMNRREQWQDVDKCGQPANNVNWKALSESPHPIFFGEHCLNPASCSPYTSSISSSANLIHKYNCSVCKPGYTGQDCGLPLEESQRYKPRKIIAPIVALLDADYYPMKEKNAVVEDSKRHTLVNIYVIGNYKHGTVLGTESNITHSGYWLASNVYASTHDATTAFRNDLKYTARWGQLAWPRELLFVNDLLPPEELWLLKYYERT